MPSTVRRADLTTGWYRRERKVFLRRNTVCYWCGRPMLYDVRPTHRLAPTVDHRTPVALGIDPADQSNWVPAHFGCNSGRSANVTRQQLRRSEVW